METQAIFSLAMDDGQRSQQQIVARNTTKSAENGESRLQQLRSEGEQIFPRVQSEIKSPLGGKRSDLELSK